MKNKKVSIISLCSLLLGYYIFRFPLFHWHRMHDIPLYLMIFGVIIVLISGFLRNNKIVPIFTSLGYILGFFCGFVFKVQYTDPGGGIMDIMWEIWVIFFGISIIVGIFVDIFLGKKNRKESDGS